MTLTLANLSQNSWIYLISAASLLILLAIILLRRLFLPPTIAPLPLSKGPASPELLPDPTSVVPPGASWQQGLAKTRAGFWTKLAAFVGAKKLDPRFLEELEATLLGADVGVSTTQLLIDRVQKRLATTADSDFSVVIKILQEEALNLINLPIKDFDFLNHHPFICLVVGVNGAGKTTTIGKLSAAWQNHSRILAAGDTFRAAAIEQLTIWGDRTQAQVISGKEGADPSSVIFEAIHQAKQKQTSIVIADTAGRLHVKTELMEELRKVHRVIQKTDPTAPHEILLVLDGTMGQNAISQAKVFQEALPISGLVLTKLDGTAKGGAVLNICHTLKIPIRYIGIGEKMQDLRPFDAQAFITAFFTPTS